MTPSPLETVARNHGAVMAERHGRRVPAHFGSTAAEEAVCQTGVGMADRSDRDTFELRGDPVAIETRPDRARRARLGLLHRRRPRRRPLRRRSTPRCPTCSAHYGDVAVTTAPPAYAAIGLDRPARARAPRTRSTSRPSGLIIREARDCFEILLPAAHGPQLWDYLVEAGEPFELACVGHDALDRLAAARR